MERTFFPFWTPHFCELQFCQKQQEIKLNWFKVTMQHVTSLIIHLYILTPGYSVAGGEFSGDDAEGKDHTKLRVLVTSLCLAMEK